MCKSEDRSWTPWMLVDVFYGIQSLFIIFLPSIWWIVLTSIQPSTSSPCLAYNDAPIVARLIVCCLITFCCVFITVLIIKYAHQRTLLSPIQERQFLILFSCSMATNAFYLIGHVFKLRESIENACWTQDPSAMNIFFPIALLCGLFSVLAYRKVIRNININIESNSALLEKSSRAPYESV